MDANYAYYCLHQLNMLPSVYLSLSRQERAFIVAAIDIKTEHEKAEKKKIENRKHSRKKR